ncbi:hypothetical protein [Actinomadura sp. HBU206391]|uniref:hypothetical protein n=1 Tax=Actinomadura sp. HBU206391 TaxID=2731692 RepID=UPI00164EF4D1|nr:hypothetical protein [Actinomadura sp. HBU206391]MBC6460268.1 hypothetical protein [Actinomadura sp. HBU206391]
MVRAAKNGMPCFDLPDPDNGEKRVTIRMGGSPWSRWERDVRAGAIDEVWFAGDPRFAGVVAIPGPRRVAFLAQPQSCDSRTAPRRRGVSPQSRERARAAGVRVG